MLSLQTSRTLRAAVSCALAAGAVALSAAPASAADPVLPALPICIQTDVLPPVGSCIPATPAPPVPTPAPTVPVPVPTPSATPEAGAPIAPARQPKGRCVDTHLRPNARNLARINGAILCLLNKERKKRGRKAVRFQKTLSGVAQRYAGQMVKEGFFDHVSPAGTTMLARIKGTNYLKGNLARWSVGENLAWGTGKLSTPARTMKAWMASKGHRHNILDPAYREIGLGVVVGTPGDASKGATYVNEFGQRIRR